MASNAYILILMTLIPVIFAQSSNETTTTGAVEVCKNPKIYSECKAEILKIAGGNCTRAISASIRTTMLQISRTITAIDKFLPAFTGNVSYYCVQVTKDHYYPMALRELESMFELLSSKEGWEDFDESLSAARTHLDGAEDDCFKEKNIFNPFHDDNVFLNKLLNLIEDIRSCLPVPVSEDGF